MFLSGVVAVIGGVGAGFASIPFLASFQPSERAKAVGAPVEVDIAALEPGQRTIVQWRGKPVWVVRRTEEQLAALEADADFLSDPASEKSEQPEYAMNSARAANAEYLVLVGLCTHLGCSPNFVPEPGAEGLGENWQGGFFCPCHGSKFDLSGRVYAGVPAPTNMTVPPYRYLTDTRILVGDDQEA